MWNTMISGKIGRRGYGWAPLMLLICGIALGQPVPSIVQPQEVERVGSARLERLGPVFVDPIGPKSATRSGDWRLSNEHFSIVIASVGDEPSTISQSIAGYRRQPNDDDHIEGAVIDVTIGDQPIDFLEYFSQGLGRNIGASVMEYDLAEPVAEDGRIGLRLEGSPSEVSPVRLSTTYWIAPDRPWVTVESRWLNLNGATPPAQLCDVGHWGTGAMLIEGLGYAYAQRAEQTETDFLMVRSGRVTLGLHTPQGRMVGKFVGRPSISRTLLAGQDATGGSAVFRREILILPGDYSRVSTWMLQRRNVNTGRMEGQAVASGTDRPAPNAEVMFLRVPVTYKQVPNLKDPIPVTEDGARPILYTVARADDEGRYGVELPEGFYYLKTTGIAPVDARKLMISAQVKADTTTTRNVRHFPEAELTIRLVDGDTRQPLAGRVRFEAIPPTPDKDFGLPERAAGYLNYSYIPPEGRQVSVPAGMWELHASRGPRYEVTMQDVETTTARPTEVTIALEQSCPTPGWYSLELGMRTRATPGVLIEPADAVLMAAAEGIDWLVSGDFETLTDFAPEIRKAGLQDVLGSSRGFRTMLPAHPEWGQFLIYPVGPDAPNPAKVRDQWADLTNSREFISTLRRLYPGALIQVELPFSKGRAGFFSYGARNPFEISFKPRPGLYLGVDAINVFPSRHVWDLNRATGHYFNHRMRKRDYILSTSSSGRMILGAEPGYPRLLVKLGDQALTEQALFEALRADRLQLTTGPFIDLRVGDRGPGGLLPLDQQVSAHARVTAPTWVAVNSVTYNKEGALQRRVSAHDDPEAVQRYPDPSVGPSHIFPLSELRMRREKDTLLNMTVMGRDALPPNVPPYSSGNQVPSFAITAPIIIDADKDGEFDEIDSYFWKGR